MARAANNGAAITKPAAAMIASNVRFIIRNPLRSQKVAPKAPESHAASKGWSLPTDQENSHLPNSIVIPGIALIGEREICDTGMTVAARSWL